MTPSAPGTICLATITDERYLAGTQVMLASFLRHNPWFDAPIVIIHDGRPEPIENALARFPNLRFHHVSAELEARLSVLAAEIPWTAPKIRRFFALEAFGLTDFDRVVLIEADVLCLGDARSLFTASGPLLCCPDQAYYWEDVRDRKTYSPSRPSPRTEGRTFDLTFNTGVLSIGPRLLEPGTYANLLARVSAETLSPVETGHTVSVVLNQYFERRWLPLPEKYNYFVSSPMTEYQRPRIHIDDAVFVHFLGQPKPWNADEDSVVREDHRGALALWRAEAAATVM